jgi:glycosyltransferase involved in cell wall biosynthesis
MKFKRVYALRYIKRRFFDLGGWGLIQVFFMVARQQGLTPALRKAWRHMFWDQGVNYFDNVQKWYTDNECSVIADHASDIFSLPSILIIGNLDLPQCKKYRVLQKAELLVSMGYECQVSEYRDITRTYDRMQLATLVIFYRVPDDELFKLYIDEVKRLNIRAGYDIDDPIFASDVYAENKNLDTLLPVEKKQLLDSADKYSSAIRQCDFVSVSTPGMKNLIEAIFDGQVFIWRNVLDGETLSISAENCQSDNNRVNKNGRLVIAYMSGSRAHDADFAVIEHVLAKILNEYPHIDLLIGGYAQVSSELLKFKDRIKRFPFSGYTGYFHYLSQADICLVPLLLDRFNECKSAIRFLEASIVGVPTIASNVGDFKNVVISGENGILVQSSQEWEESIRQLVTDKETREELGEAARQYVLKEQTVESLAEKMKNQLSTMLQA